MPAMTLSRRAFVPTPAQIEAAKTLFAAMALEQTVRPIVEQYETAILARHRFPVAGEWVEKGLAAQGELVLDPTRSYLLAEADAAAYYAECHAARDAAGLQVRGPDHCPRCEAETLRMEAEAALLRAVAATPGLEHLPRAYLNRVSDFRE